MHSFLLETCALTFYAPITPLEGLGDAHPSPESDLTLGFTSLGTPGSCLMTLCPSSPSPMFLSLRAFSLATLSPSTTQHTFTAFLSATTSQHN